MRDDVTVVDVSFKPEVTGMKGENVLLTPKLTRLRPRRPGRRRRALKGRGRRRKRSGKRRKGEEDDDDEEEEKEE